MIYSTSRPLCMCISVYTHHHIHENEYMQRDMCATMPVHASMCTSSGMWEITKCHLSCCKCNNTEHISYCIICSEQNKLQQLNVKLKSYNSSALTL